MTYGFNKTQIDDFFQNLSKLIEPDYLDGIYLKIFMILEGIGYNTETLINFIAQPCGNLLKSCYWFGNEYNCSDIFDAIQTISGICCTFNYHGLTDGLIMDYRTTNRTDDLLYVLGSGKDVGLAVELNIETDSYVSPTVPFYGVQIFIHHSYEQPSGIASTIIQPGHDLSINIVPTAVVSDNSIRNVPVKQRRCYFDDEKLLRNSKYYSFDSCMMECRVDTIFELCACVPFNFPETSMFLFHKIDSSEKD